MKKQRQKLKVFSRSGIYLGDREETFLDKYGILILVTFLIALIISGSICISLSFHNFILPDLKSSTNAAKINF